MPTPYRCRDCDVPATRLDCPEASPGGPTMRKAPRCERHARPTAQLLPPTGLDDEDCCLGCGAHISRRHESGCLLDICPGCGCARSDVHYADCPGE
jgi:hypothetical protein